MVFNLNRAYTFENLEHVPYSVLVAIVRTCGKNIDLQIAKQKKEEVISFINSYRHEISNDFSDLTKDDYLDITTFIGGDGRWTKDTIVKALKSIVQFNRKPVINFDNFHTGYKDSRNLDNYDIIMIYKFCVYHNIKTNLDDDLDDFYEKAMDYNERIRGEKEKHEVMKLEEMRRKEEEQREQKDREEKEREEREQKIKEQREQREREEEFEKTKDELRNLQSKYEQLEKDFSSKVLEEKLKVSEQNNNKVKELETHCDKLVNERNDLETQYQTIKNKYSDLEQKLEETKQAVKTTNTEIIVPDNLSMENLKVRFFNNYENFNQKQLQQIALILSQNESVKTSVNKNFSLLDINMNFIVGRSVLTPEEAVIFAVKVFSFDLRISNNKVKHILELNKCRQSDKVFQPTDNDYFSSYLQMNKDIFSLDQYWFADLEDSYSTKASSSLVINQEVENLEELKNIYKTNNFHRGWVPSSKTDNISEQKTFFKGNFVKDLKKHNIFSFGVPWKKIIYFQPEEYIEFLSSKEYPASPLDFNRSDDEDRKMVEKKHIDRLRDIGKDFSSNSDYGYMISSLDRKMKNMNKTSSTPKSSSNGSRSTPVKTVKKAQTPKNDSKSIEMKFLNQYLYNADKYDGILGELFKLGLYLRGWKIRSTELPIKKDSIISYKDYQDEINENVIKTVDRLQDLKLATFDILTVVSYDKNRKTFNYEQDLLWEIVDQLKEIKTTVFLDLMSKSNKLLVSVYHYNMIATKKKLFEIDDL